MKTINNCKKRCSPSRLKETILLHRQTTKSSELVDRIGKLQETALNAPILVGAGLLLYVFHTPRYETHTRAHSISDIVFVT